MQKSIITRLGIILLVTVLCGLVAWPPGEKLRLGKDLAGGVSLVYSVSMENEPDPAGVLNQVITVLKERVDPDGLMEIAIVAQGRDRLEITMPLPTAKVKQLKQAYDDALSELAKIEITESRLDRELAKAPAERAKALETLAGGNSQRLALLNDLAKAYDSWSGLETAYNALPEDNQEARRALVADVATASLTYDKAKEAVLATVVSPEEIRAVVAASTKTRSVKDGRKVVELPSRRLQAETHIREAHPGSGAEIDRILGLHAAYMTKRKTLDDPNDLVRMLQGAGVLSFRITVKPGELAEEAQLRAQLQERGPRNVESRLAHWFKINQIESWVDQKKQADFLFESPANVPVYFQNSYGAVAEFYQGDYYMLCYTGPGKELVPTEGDSWRVASAGQTMDELGRPAIRFEMDPRGAVKLGDLTRANVQRQMAVLLDDQVYTAPTLESAISSSGRITGKFDQSEVEYIVRVLGGGALQAKLSKTPISVNNQAPELGKDNLDAGLRAGVYSFMMCAGFLIAYYFWCGLNATFALIINLVLLIGAMAANHAAFTLPGIAGVILALAMAVDANVLIYERMREEMALGGDLKKAVRLGYDKAMSAIIDGNLTHLIVCMVLGFIGTVEIRGFAISMGIGVVTTLFSQLVVTRWVFDVGIEYFGWKRAPMLPMVVPAVQRAFEVNVDWMSLRKYSTTAFVVLIVASLAMVAARGEKLLDTEFLGGSSITIKLKNDDAGKPTKLSRQQVEDRLDELADSNKAKLNDLRTADILVVNPDSDGFTSNTFTIKTLVTDTTALNTAISAKFADLMDVQVALTFKGGEITDSSKAPVYPIVNQRLGPNIDRPAVSKNVADFLGGVAIALERIQPPISAAALKARIENTRAQSEFNSTVGRPTEVVVLDGTDEAATSAVILVRDPDVSFFGSPSWNSVVRDREWRLAQSALTTPSQFLNVQSFSPAVARTFVAQAIGSLVIAVVLITVFVWVRFNSLRYSVAAIVPTLLDCMTVTGLLALAGFLCDGAPALAQALKLMPFKLDLTAIASLLTILGYSINDKIVLLDRIRENRGKLTQVSRETINDSINQTMSRTLMTGTTTILSTLILYLIGGEAVRAFAYTLGLGVVIGTISSVVLGAPMVWSSKMDRSAEPEGTAPAAA
ncbi:MAG: protein translocase subunit SecD [Phycisphaerales bacterium]